MNPLDHPARVVPVAFLAAILVGAALLMLPASRAGPDPTPVVTALFTAASAVCVTGLIVVDTATYWSGFGQLVILILIQIGGFGIMTGASLLGAMATGRLRLSDRLLAQAETKAVALGDIMEVLRVVLIATLAIEATLAMALTSHFIRAYGMPPLEAAWHGLFHAVSAFNNAGFSTFTEGAVKFASDGLVLTSLMLGVIVGGIGFPVLAELRRNLRTPDRWSLHTRLTLIGTAALLAAGFAATLAWEWANPSTLGPMDVYRKLLNAMFHSVVSRTAGFNSVDVGAMHEETLLVTTGLMMVGGGSAGTAGGIKITTFLLLGAAVLAEARGRPDVSVFGRRVPSATVRQALAVVLLAVGVIAAAVLALLSLTELPLQPVLFEVVSAFATVGLSTGVTADLPDAAKLVLIALMFVGRVGPTTLAAGLALSRRGRAWRYPEERPIVG